MARARQSNLYKFFSINFTNFIIIFNIILIIVIEADGLIRKKRIVGGRHAAQPPEDDPVVFINENNRDSRIHGERDPNKGFYVFKGIRFGEPPIGRSRFQRARAVHLNREYNATRWGPPCPQDYNGKIIGSEDCLFLNVFTPQLPDSGDGYPVLIWIHGGGFKIGTACQYEMRNLIKKQLIVVSIQYRLGSLGFLSVGKSELPGNNGMYDMLLAVKWVKKYIKYFGGNPNKIVTFGHGSGASSALMLSLSKLTNNYFSGLIAMSGSLLSHFAFDKDPTATSKVIATNNNCPTDNVTNMIHCLQELPIERIINVDSKIANIRIASQGFLSGISSLLVPGPVIEGNDDLRSLPNFMTDTPENSLKLGKFPSIPLLMGVMKDESDSSILGGYSSEIMKNLKTMSNYVEQKKKLLMNLQKTIPIFENTSRQFIPEAFDKYFGIDNLELNLKNIAKSINDAIFNVPAFLNVKHWSKKAKTYFYSFDYMSKKPLKNDFLSGLPIVDAKNLRNGAHEGHGDDLRFIFDQNYDRLGNKLNNSEVINEKNIDDEQVSEILTNMISQFARLGTIGDHSAENESFPGTNLFHSDDSNTVLSVTNKLTPKKNFKFCELALWTGAVDQLLSSYCDSIRVTTQTIERLTAETKKITDLVSSPVNKIDKFQNVGEKVIPNIDNQMNNTMKIINTNSSSYKPKIPSFGILG